MITCLFSYFFFKANLFPKEGHSPAHKHMVLLLLPVNLQAIFLQAHFLFSATFVSSLHSHSTKNPSDDTCSSEAICPHEKKADNKLISLMSTICYGYDWQGVAAYWARHALWLTSNYWKEIVIILSTSDPEWKKCVCYFILLTGWTKFSLLY